MFILIIYTVLVKPPLTDVNTVEFSVVRRAVCVFEENLVMATVNRMLFGRIVRFQTAICVSRALV